MRSGKPIKPYISLAGLNEKLQQEEMNQDKKSKN